MQHREKEPNVWQQKANWRRSHQAEEPTDEAGWVALPNSTNQHLNLSTFHRNELQIRWVRPANGFLLQDGTCPSSRLVQLHTHSRFKSQADSMLVVFNDYFSVCLPQLDPHRADRTVVSHTPGRFTIPFVSLFFFFQLIKSSTVIVTQIQNKSTNALLAPKTKGKF